MMPEKNRFAAVLVPQGGSFSSEVTHSLRAEGFDASEDGAGRGTPLAVVPLDMRQCSRGERMTNNRTDGGAPGTGIGKPGDPAPSLAGSHVPAIAYGIHSDCIDRTGEGSGGSAAERAGLGISENQSPCLNAKRPNAVACGMENAAYAVRRLTPAECLKLQGFPPDYLDIMRRGKPAADNAKYRAIGNSMCVNVVRWIGERIEAMEAPTPSSCPAEGARQ